MDRRQGLALAVFLNNTSWYFILNIIGGFAEIPVLKTIGDIFGVSALLIGFAGVGLYLLKGGE